MTGTEKSLGLLVTQTGHTSHGHWSVATQTEAPWLVTLTVHWPSLAIPKVTGCGCKCKTGLLSRAPPVPALSRKCPIPNNTYISHWGTPCIDIVRFNPFVLKFYLLKWSTKQCEIYIIRLILHLHPCFWAQNGLLLWLKVMSSFVKRNFTYAINQGSICKSWC